MPEKRTKASNKKASKRPRGFAAMDNDKQREIASKGGRIAHAKGTAHEFTPDEAREAGRKGGESVSQNREHMATIGRTGGKQSRGGRRTGNRNGNGAENSTSEANESTAPAHVGSSPS